MENNQTVAPKNLAEALAKAQSEIEDPTHNCTVDMTLKSGRKLKYTYADLKACLVEIRKVFPKYGLSLTQMTSIKDNNICLETKILHTSGQFESSTIILPPWDDIKDHGCDMTYMRRYQLSAICGIYSDKDLDQGDPEKESPNDKKEKEPKEKKESKPIEPGTISIPQIKMLFTIASLNGWQNEDVKNYLQMEFGVDSTKEILKKDYEKICQFLAMGHNDPMVQL